MPTMVPIVTTRQLRFQALLVSRSRGSVRFVWARPTSSDDVATVYPRAALSIKSGDDAFVFLSGQTSPNFAE